MLIESGLKCTARQMSGTEPTRTLLPLRACCCYAAACPPTCCILRPVFLACLWLPSPQSTM